MPEKEEEKDAQPQLKPLRDTNKEDVLTNALDFWKKIYEAKEVQIRFLKKNGEIRYMRATLDFTKIPVEKRPKKVDMVSIIKMVREKGIIRVYDLEKKDWRSVPFQEVTWLKTSDNKTFRVMKDPKNYATENRLRDKQFIK
jgi:hypothetical protein